MKSRVCSRVRMHYGFYVAVCLLGLRLPLLSRACVNTNDFSSAPDGGTLRPKGAHSTLEL